MAGVVLFGMLVGIAIAVGLSIAELFARIARAHDAVQGAVPGLAGLHDVDDYPDAATIPGLVVYRYHAPLCFANAEDFRTLALDRVKHDLVVYLDRAALTDKIGREHVFLTLPTAVEGFLRHHGPLH